MFDVFLVQVILVAFTILAAVAIVFSWLKVDIRYLFWMGALVALVIVVLNFVVLLGL